MVFHLARFLNGYFSGSEKNKREVEFDDHMNLPERNGERKVRFELVGVVHH
jgi:hypothetical protein